VPDGCTAAALRAAVPAWKPAFQAASAVKREWSDPVSTASRRSMPARGRRSEAFRLRGWVRVSRSAALSRSGCRPEVGAPSRCCG